LFNPFVLYAHSTLPLQRGRWNPKKDIGIEENKKTPFGREVSVI
jgi:hypothetical protein